MSEETATERRHEEHRDPVTIQAGLSLRPFEIINDNIAKRAYEKYDARGQSHGNDMDDWLAAEYELFSGLPVEHIEEGGRIVVKAHVRGFDKDDIEVYVEPWRLLIVCQSDENQEEGSNGSVLSEERSKEVYRSLSLPYEVDINTSTASFRDGVLEVVLPKANQS